MDKSVRGLWVVIVCSKSTTRAIFNAISMDFTAIYSGVSVSFLCIMSNKNGVITASISRLSRHASNKY